MCNQVFVGGWENTGTRLIVKLLKYKNFNTLKSHCNKQYDYKHKNMERIVYDILYNNGDKYHITNLILYDIKNIRKWVIKNGYLMLFIPLLKKIFPESKFILCIRHPLDTLIKPSHNYKRFGNTVAENPPIMEKFELYKKWYDEALLYTDYIIKLEDLLYNKEETIYNLYKFLDINTEITEKILKSINSPSNNVGKCLTIMHYIHKLGYEEKDTVEYIRYLYIN